MDHLYSGKSSVSPWEVIVLLSSPTFSSTHTSGDSCDKKTKEKQYDIAAKFNKTGRFIDDLFTLNNDLVMQEYMSHIYPPELLLNKENENDTHTTFLDLDISLTDNKITHALYDKRDDFPFEIVNFPHLDGNVPPTHMEY